MNTEKDLDLLLNGSKVPYVPGCTLKTTARNFEISAIAAARALGIELVELPRWNCCGTVFSLSADDQYSVRQQKIGYYGSLEEGRMVIDNRVLTGIVVAGH